ncbi:MAG: SRPBCC domain-containing protein [Phycisphaerales bacterium]|nr:SRPBCC domain-containing protein [Phycisphaerales bacterium]MCB9857651.1 SRPBCC domain-containing protein [Phycisphaerales bacterium]
MIPANSNTDGRLVVDVSGVIRAAPDAVFDAWVDPAIRRKWWLNVRGEGPTVCEIDARVGGRYTIKQIGSGSETADKADTYEWIMTGEFLEVVRPERLVFTWNVNNPDEPVVDQRVTVTFAAESGGTRIRVVHEGIHSEHLRDGTDAGWTSMIDSINEILAQ